MNSYTKQPLNTCGRTLLGGNASVGDSLCREARGMMAARGGADDGTRAEWVQVKNGPGLAKGLARGSYVAPLVQFVANWYLYWHSCDSLRASNVPHSG